jgi:hypothetical protein
MLVDKLTSTYPAGDVTDGQYLYRSLGSFWTQIFQDKNVLKGYTTAMAEEVIQSYYNLIETVNQYSVKDIDLYHKEKWLPLIIKKSEYNKAPFVFSSTGAVFGYQPASDLFYADQLFRFGFPKETLGGKIFSYTPPFNLANMGLLANRVISPSLVLVPGVDILIRDNTLYFKIDLFDNEYIPRAKVVGDFGEIATFKNTEGQIVEDEFIILWTYMAEVDNKELYKTFGTLLEINLPTSESYKTLLKALINLYVEGPTITALNAIFATLVNSPIVLETVEEIEDIYSDEKHQYVITNKHVYKLSPSHLLLSDLEPGALLYAGETLTEGIRLIDTLIDPLWWKNNFYISKLGFPSYIFAADTKNQLFFANSYSPLTYTGGNPVPNRRIVFPVTGRPSDVEAFQDYINHPSRKSTLLEKLQLAEGRTSTVMINPVDFLFTNFIKNNTLFLKLDFYTQEQLTLFFSLLPSIQPYLPPHVFLLVYLQLQLNEEVMTNLNNKLEIAAYPRQLFSIDGSDSVTGRRPGNLNDPEYYKDYVNRMFCVSVGPYKNGQPLHADGSAKYANVTNIDNLTIDNAVSPGTGVRAGILRTEIPLQVKPPGELFWRTPSTREVPTILLIDF